jgi:hypothetical protein
MHTQAESTTLPPRFDDDTLTCLLHVSRRGGGQEIAFWLFTAKLNLNAGDADVCVGDIGDSVLDTFNRIPYTVQDIPAKIGRAMIRNDILPSDGTGSGGVSVIG